MSALYVFITDTEFRPLTIEEDPSYITKKRMA